MKRYFLLPLMLLSAIFTRLTAQPSAAGTITSGTIAPGHDTSPALFQSIRSGSTAELEKQLAAGADPNDSLNGYSALMAATLNGSADQMQLLIRHGANVNYQDKNGITALWLAIPDQEKTLLLLDHGADIAHRIEGYGVLAKLASIPGSSALFHLLIARGAEPRKSAPDNYLLYAAASSGDTAILGPLLRMGFNANDSIAFGDYPLNGAQAFRSFPTVKMLVDNGADVNARSMYMQTLPAQVGFTPLMWAALNNDKASLLYLLDHGADPKIKNKMGFTTLMLLQQSECDDPDMTLALLTHGADPTVKMPDGSDALSYALKKGNTKSAALLKQYSR